MDIKKMAAKRASKSNCKYKISAIGLNKKGDIIGSSFNKKRFGRKGGGIHAEILLMRKFPKALKTIIICRVNPSGKIIPISACENCSRKAKELGIKIISIEDV